MDNEAAVIITLPGGEFASADTLLSSVAFLRNTLAGLGFCQDLNLLSTDPNDVAHTCNTIYGLLLQHQKDTQFKEQLKSEMHRMRLDSQAAERDRLRQDSKLQAKDREIGGLLNKQKSQEEGQKREMASFKKECDDYSKKLSAQDRRLVQLQHEVKRKEKDYERLQEKLSHYLADKKNHDKTVLEQAGKVAQQLAVTQAARRTDEGLKAVVAAYEQRQDELVKENKDLKASLSSLQSEYKEAVNRQTKQRRPERSFSAPMMEDSLIQAVPMMSEEELRAEFNARMNNLTQQLKGIEIPTPVQSGVQTSLEQQLIADFQVAQSVLLEQEKLLGLMLAALRATQQSKDAQHAADVKRLAQHYQAQLAAAEGEIQKAQHAQASIALQLADDDKAALQEQLAVLEMQLEAERSSKQAQEEAMRNALEQERKKLNASMAQERMAVQLQAQEVIESQRRFEMLQRNYQDLMRKWAPGVGAGLFLERAVSRKAGYESANAISSIAHQKLSTSTHPVQMTVDARG